MAVLIFSAHTSVVKEIINAVLRIHRRVMEEKLIVDNLMFE